MPEIWFISGPPFDTAIWQAVEARVHDLGCCARTWPCLTAGSGDIAEEVARLSADLDSVEHDVILVGHGSALPMVRASSTHPRVAGIVLSNGPGLKLDRLNRLWTRLFSMPQPIRQGVLGPALMMPILQSSVGLRRTVVNPYVMDHDTVVAICEPIFSNEARRERAATYFRSLTDLPEIPLNADIQTLFCWGDSDPVGADTYDDLLQINAPNITHSPIPGGRFMHPVERPWEFADRVVDWLKNWSTTT